MNRTGGLSLNINDFREKSNFIWGTADLIRDTFKRGKYQDVILPFTVLRRIDSVLVPTKEKVIETYIKFKGKLDNLDAPLRKASGYAFYNTSPYTFEKLLDDAPNLAANLRSYIISFSPNMVEVLEKFDFYNTITTLDEYNLLFLVMERFKNIDLHPEKVSNLEMGYIFEDLIRRFNEALNENPGEHYTPREVIRLMVNLLLSRDEEALSHNHIVRTVYDPCCGSGGMLTIAQERILEINSNATVYLFGQEVNPETYAVSKADMYLKSADGRDAENIRLGSTLSHDQHQGKTFDYMLTNPPYGKDWKMDETAVKKEAQRGAHGRFAAGTPSISDGQLLFLQHMLSKMIPLENGKGGSRIAIVLNGSPLFTGDAGQGETNIRRWILENDWLEAIIALPEQIFYNTSIATYVWVLSNHKEERRKGKVQLINATELYLNMRKSLGQKRREVSDDHISQITDLYNAFEESEIVKIFDTTDFGYRKIVVERPLRLNFQVTPERLALLNDETQFKNLAISKKKDPAIKTQEEELGRREQARVLAALQTIPGSVYTDRKSFEKALDKALNQAHVSIKAPLRKAILNALSQQDEAASICLDKKGQPEPDTSLRDTENVPLKEGVFDYFDREVKPFVADAWIDEKYRDELDGLIGRVGYEINFNRYFYKYQPPRPLEDIENEIQTLQKEIIDLLGEL